MYLNNFELIIKLADHVKTTVFFTRFVSRNRAHIETLFDQDQTKFLSIFGKVGFQSGQIIAASWSGNTCHPSNQLIITLIRLLLDQD